jgi:IS5 family transposase
MARPRADLPAHGTRRRYQHRSEPCRCGACTEANAKYVAGRRAVRDLLARVAHQPALYHDVPAVMVGCTHSLGTIGQPCPWCGHTVDHAAPVPGLVAA